MREHSAGRARYDPEIPSDYRRGSGKEKKANCALQGREK
jgi:hypothetical protein